MSELLVVWGNDPNEVVALCETRADGRAYRVLRRGTFALASAESTGGDAIDSTDATYCAVIEIR